MRMEAAVTIVNANPSIIVEHEGDRLIFTISFYRRNIFTGDYDIFQQINRYWEDQPLEVQAKIFDIYKKIFHAFDQFMSKDEIREFLQLKVQELFLYHNVEHIQEWIAFRSTDIQLPASIVETFVPNVDRNTTIGKTYLAADYRRLTALSLALRCMIPIWSEYIGSIKQEADDNFREMLAFQLVDRVLTPQLPVIAKLLDYIENTIPSSNTFKTANVFKGISSSDYPRWLLSLICIRCLAVGDLRGINPDAHLVTFIHMLIMHRLSDKNEMGELKIKDKKIDESMGEDGAKASALERYKVKANVSIGDIVELEYFLSDFIRVAQRLAPGISIEEVQRGLEHVKDYEGTPTLPQINLLRIVYKPIASPRSILYLHEQLIKQLLGIMEAVLWHRGHKYLAILSTCTPIRSDKEMVISPVDSKMRIPEALMNILEQLFPFKRNQRNKKVILKETNLAVESIDNLTNNFMIYGWKPTTESERIEEVLGYKTTRFPIKPDIKTDLSRLVIEIQNRKAH